MPIYESFFQNTIPSMSHTYKILLCSDHPFCNPDIGGTCDRKVCRNSHICVIRVGEGNRVEVLSGVISIKV